MLMGRASAFAFGRPTTFCQINHIATNPFTALQNSDVSADSSRGISVICLEAAYYKIRKKYHPYA